MRNRILFIFIFSLFTIHSLCVFGIQRFPKPEFESGYVQPETLVPNSRAEALAYLDIVVLLASLSLVTWLVLKRRSRKGVFWMSMFSLAYFGFYREGCVCAIGSIQNVSLALFDHSYFIPISAIVFFSAPLVFSLFFGRTFCGGVCPFGAMQDLVSISPQKLGLRLNTVLGLIPYLYLGLAVLYAATGTDFIICRYDPFVGIWRLNASFGMFVFAAVLLLSGIFIARPYCRFLCPYGVLLNWTSRFSKKHMTITPAECIQCRLCEDSCPYDAIDFPTNTKETVDKRVMARKLVLISILIPILVVLGGYTGSLMHETLAGVNSKVILAKQIVQPETKTGVAETFEIQAFKEQGKKQEVALAEAKNVLNQFYLGGWLLGGFVGLVFGGLIAGRMLTRHKTDYTPNRARCFSCARCMEYCPVPCDG